VKVIANDEIVRCVLTKYYDIFSFISTIISFGDNYTQSFPDNSPFGRASSSTSSTRGGTSTGRSRTRALGTFGKKITRQLSQRATTLLHILFSTTSSNAPPERQRASVVNASPKLVSVLLVSATTNAHFKFRRDSKVSVSDFFHSQPFV
jgi:hypothetical protein